MICDSSLFIAHLRRDQAAGRFLSDHRTVVTIPFVVVAELLTGARRSRHPAIELQKVNDVISLFPIEWPTVKTIEHFSIVHAELLRDGTPIGVHDTWIAAFARQDGLPIVTRDSDFSRVSGVSVIQW